MIDRGTDNDKRHTAGSHDLATDSVPALPLDGTGATPLVNYFYPETIMLGMRIGTVLTDLDSLPCPSNRN